MTSDEQVLTHVKTVLRKRKKMSEKLKQLELEALLDAANRQDGLDLFKRKTTEKLAERGYFVKDDHPSYGKQWRITEEGRAALSKAGASQ